MLYAISQDGHKIRPFQGASAFCPFCKETVIAKCGLINAHHWAHLPQSHSACVTTSEYESESEWHYTFKGLFPKENVEILVQKENVKMRADVKLPNGLVLEIQHSSISPKIIKNRNNFHRKIVWLFDVSGPFAADRIHYWGFDGLNRLINRQAKYEWIQPAKSIRYAASEKNNPVFFDLGFGKIIEVKDLWFSQILFDTHNIEKFGQYTKKYKFEGQARAYANYSEFVDRIYQIDNEWIMPKSRDSRKAKHRKRNNKMEISFLNH